MTKEKDITSELVGKIKNSSKARDACKVLADECVPGLTSDQLDSLLLVFGEATFASSMMMHLHSSMKVPEMESLYQVYMGLYEKFALNAPEFLAPHGQPAKA